MTMHYYIFPFYTLIISRLGESLFFSFLCFYAMIRWRNIRFFLFFYLFSLFSFLH